MGSYISGHGQRSRLYADAKFAEWSENYVAKGVSDAFGTLNDLHVVFSII